MFKRMTAVSATMLVVIAGLIGLSASPALAAVTYHYAVGEQSSIVADGAAVNITVESPAGDATHDGASSHSLGELIVRSTDLKDSIEIGWRKPATSATAFFVYHTVNGVPMGYNLCTDYSAEPFNAGDLIPSTMVGTGVGPRFEITHSGTNWWVAFNLKWVCSFPDSVWTSAGRTFNKVNYVQAYGEVASTSTTKPCTDMGDGQAATSGTAARIGSYSLNNQTSGSAPAFNTYTLPSTAGITINAVSATTFRYGWSGYTAAGTLPGNTGSC